ncbi:MAG: hypothetical protein HQ526_05545 [Actinobacteria bacterium]|nr:hypothetical protein [Actinomycetota bacterium]
MLISDASALGVSKLAAEAVAGRTTVLELRHQPIAAVISYTELTELRELRRDLLDLCLVLAREATTTVPPVALDDVISALGFTREQIEAMPDPA